MLDLDPLSMVLLPFVGLISAAVLIARPKSAREKGSLPRALLGLALLLALFASRDPLVIAALWTATIAPLLVELHLHGERGAFRVAAIYLGASAVFVVVGAVLIVFVPEARGTGALVVLLGAMVRKGIFPFQSWVPEVFERGPWGAALTFTAPQAAAYTVVRLVVPHASTEVLAIVGVSALFTAVYGGGVALVQRNARRAFGYLFMSQSSLVMAGLDCVSVESLAGALTTWVSSGLALTGLGLAMWMLEVRSGKLRLDRFRGGYENKPGLAVGFLLLGLAVVGFPGTLGFVAEELLIDGTVSRFPHIGFATAVATALGGICVLRMYFALFCGRATQRMPLRLRRRELLAVMQLAVILVALGLAPSPLVALHTDTAERLLERRAMLSR